MVIAEPKPKTKKMLLNLAFQKCQILNWQVAKKIKGFVAGGGYMFAMCTATDTYDIALAVEGHDIVDRFYDGDGAEKLEPSGINYDKNLCFSRL